MSNLLKIKRFPRQILLQKVRFFEGFPIFFESTRKVKKKYFQPTTNSAVVNNAQAQSPENFPSSRHNGQTVTPPAEIDPYTGQSPAGPKNRLEPGTSAPNKGQGMGKSAKDPPSLYA